MAVAVGGAGDRGRRRGVTTGELVIATPGAHVLEATGELDGEALVVDADGEFGVGLVGAVLVPLAAAGLSVLVALVMVAVVLTGRSVARQRRRDAAPGWRAQA